MRRSYAGGDVVAANGQNIVFAAPGMLVLPPQRASCGSRCCGVCGVLTCILLTAVFSIIAVAMASLLFYSAGAALDGTVHITGNTAAATVQTEPSGFMHVVAATQADVYRTLGFVSSKQRLLQMDFQRRVGRGNLSAFLGTPDALPIDIYFRQLGWYTPPHP